MDARNNWARSSFRVSLGMVSGFFTLLAVAVPSFAEEEPTKPIAAPPKHAIVGETLNGWYFAPKELKDSYEQALKLLDTLQGQVDAGELDHERAKRDFERIRERLKSLRKTIDESRVHVAGAALHEQTETREFPLGPERRLAITGNKIRIVGWDGPQVKAELKKIVLAPDGNAVEDDLKAIAIVHSHKRAEFAGRTDAEWEASEAEFLAGDGAKLTPEQRASRQSLVEGIRHSYRVHRELVGKTIDQLSIKGLDYQSNRVINWRVSSENGDGQWGSVRQRYAELTVYVPSCTSVTVRGAARGLVVENLAASLTIVPEDSTDSDPRARFEVNGLQGNLVCRQFPLRKVMNVKGNIEIEATTDDFNEGEGTSHHNDLITITPGRPDLVEIEQVTGNLLLHYGRTKLDVRQIGGTVNIANDFGDTRVTWNEPLSQTAHRLFSLAGRIDVELSSRAFASLPITVATNHGTVRTNVSREELPEYRVRGIDSSDQMTRKWSGFHSKPTEPGHLNVMQLVDRFAAIASSGRRSPGLDILSRSGRVTVLRN